MKLHNLLARQLMKLKLNAKDVPNDKEAWAIFLEKVNKSYQEADQERYLLERSMEISSKEMWELNSKLESAQQIARLGYWYYDREHEQIIWSNELYTLMGLEYDKAVPDLSDLYSRIHPDDVELLKELVELAFKDGAEYETEVRMKPFSDADYRWFYVVGKPLKVLGKPITKLNGIMLDITKRKETEEEVNQLHQQLIQSARRAGMADVATSILHNVGNILNSANVSVNLMLENIRAPYFEKLFTVNNLIQQHVDDLENYLTKDEKGKYVISYLHEVNSKIKDIHDTLLNETVNVKLHLDHIKDITNMQKTLSGTSSVFEKIWIVEAIETAIKMCGDAFNKHHITINKYYEARPFITTDSTKLLQIIVNVIQNAKDALLSIEDARYIDIAVKLSEDDKEQMQLIISDNGVGVASENLNNIFSFGFTTKASGHGFGLHSSALAAKELGGDLQVSSMGINQGASFTLTLPLKTPVRRMENESTN